jgi:glyoxylase-like metal-dependent hydrolase (beta-lactamase superfamily II)
LKEISSVRCQYPYKLNDNIWVLGNYYINIYLIVGQNKCALFEVGISATVDSVISQLDQLQVEPDYLIITHPHADHITGHEGLNNRYPGAKTILGDGTFDFTHHPKAKEMIVSEDKYMTCQIGNFGILPGRPPVGKVPTFDSPIIVENEIIIDLGNIEIDLFSVKGHSPGDIIGFVPSLRTAIVSDSIGFFYPGRDLLPLYLTGYEMTLRTIDKTISLNPEVICPGHQGPIFGLNANKILHNARKAMVDLYSYILNNREGGENLSKLLFKRFYVDELTLYSPSSMFNCIELLIKRSMQAQ